MPSRKMEKSRFIKCFCIAGLMAALASGAARASDKPEDGKAKASEGAKSGTKALCDDEWYGGFWTIAVDEKKYDGNAKNLKDYDPQHPDEAWQVLSERYFGLKDCCGNIRLHRFLGRFYDRKEADAFLRRVYKDSGLARHLNPRYPPTIIKPDALLVSDKFACTLNKENDVLRHADWIVELEGNLFAGAESRCTPGKNTKKKSITVVDCSGSKKVLVDTLDVPCGTSVRSCLYPLPDQAFALDHVYSEAGEGTSVVVRAYDIKKKLRVFSVDETNDGGPDAELISVEDVDGDGVPEIVHRVAGTDEIVSKMKWRNRRFIKDGR